MSNSPVAVIESVMTPKEIVHELDRFIIGQDEAKRKVAIALRNRWRRMQLPEDLRHEVTPKNILMIGPTGVGKTEIARRLAKLAKAPFLKIEATKFTEVGFVGRDVDSIIRDLADTAVKLQRALAVKRVQQVAEEAAEERVLDILLPPAKGGFSNTPEKTEGKAEKETETRVKFRKKLRKGELDNTEIEVSLQASPMGVEIMAPPGMEEMTSQLSSMFQNLSTGRKKTRKMKIKDAMKAVREEEASHLIDEEEIKRRAIESVEQNGIVFIDEIDKICRRSEGGSSGADVSREGVQRDLLPIIEGSTVTTKYGAIKTDHILFIASGAFHIAKPSDLIPELQGRLPIRVELKSLDINDFMRILTEPKASLTEQYRELLATEGVEVDFQGSGVRRMAEIAFQINDRQENIGARRLYTVMEKLLEDISFHASDRSGEKVLVDEAYVNRFLEKVAVDEDLSRYIL